MNTSTPTRPAGSKASCGCGGGSTGTPVPGGCGCAGAGCASCQVQGLARPRFFAGQLLTDDDLQALSDYVVGKNRLHNRHFVGDGVVCGLQVSCHPCGGGKLLVQPGHALDCCGNDLVLECAVELDANALVRDLRRSQLGGYDCGEPCPEPKPAGGKGERPIQKSPVRHYALYLRYTEEPSDAVAPYATGEPCGTTACEPTRLREGVRFELRCRPVRAAPDGFLQRALGCLSDLMRAEVVTAAMKKLYEKGATPQDVAAAREALLDQLDASPQMADCGLRAEVAAMQVPAQGSDLQPASEQLVAYWKRLMRDCVCRALLPPCPPCDDPAVLLATLEIRDCEVLDICNLERKLVLTGPNIRYWFPVDLLGDLLESLCCPAEKCEDAAAPAPTPKPPPAASPAATAPKAKGQAQASDPVKPTPAADAAALGDMVSEHLLKTFRLTRADAAGLGRIRENLSDVFSAGAFDDVLPARILRRTEIGSTVRDAITRQVVESPEFRKLSTDLSQQNVANLEAARREFQQQNAKASESLAAQNQALRAQLGTVVERLKKLEGGAPPRPDEPSPKTRK